MTENLQDIRREMERRSTSELVSILRNRDEEEWRPEVFQIVAAILVSRGISAGEITALGPEGVDVVETQQLVTVGWYSTSLEAHSHRLALEAAGLRSWLCDEVTSTMFGMGIDICSNQKNASKETRKFLRRAPCSRRSNKRSRSRVSADVSRT